MEGFDIEAISGRVPPVTSALTDKGGTSQWSKLRQAAALQLQIMGSVVCWRCGKIVTPDMPWVLGHVIDRALGGDDSELAIEHDLCSKRSGWALGRALKAASQSMIITAEPGELFSSTRLLGRP